jgi:hypothetical protein
MQSKECEDHEKCGQVTICKNFCQKKLPEYVRKQQEQVEKGRLTAAEARFKSYKYAAKLLNKVSRSPHPPCIVSKIRDGLPEQSHTYVGYKKRKL